MSLLEKVGVPKPDLEPPFFKPKGVNLVRLVAFEQVGGYKKKVPKKGRSIEDDPDAMELIPVFCDVVLDHVENGAIVRKKWNVTSARAMHALDKVPDLGVWFHLVQTGSKHSTSYTARIGELNDSEKDLVARLEKEASS